MFMDLITNWQARWDLELNKKKGKMKSTYLSLKIKGSLTDTR